ncbi:ZIP family metal transporter [Acidovorax sp. NCPPB 3576]|uniref:ZIP family metal transporter n=1 Tax=Acidovorax sp. NCPPB 3576 TaxID=2940488 RepID=UPI00234954D8|nr:ZIP family metal transporter [Acidovorax sp. NCPPB 3576]WCM90925.1 ZIP family metal transporter [Acidovorax sp. NCPPB 3576]
MHHALSWRQWLGLGIVATGAAILGAQAMGGLVSGDDRMRGALLGGLMAAAATALGTLPVLLSQKFSQRTHDTMLGFGAGVMLAASAFSLVIPALAAAKSQGAGPWGAGSIVGAGILGGALLLLLIDRAVPHEHFVKGLEGPQARAIKRAWLFVLAITLHNLPEGLAIGVAFAGPDGVGAKALAAGISIQDVPEGMVVALALRGVGYGRWMSAGLGVVSGLIEPVAAIMGVALIGLSASLLPWGLAAAAGAMLYVISHEIIPESHRKGHEAFATGGLMLGFVVMMLLDTALG